MAYYTLKVLISAVAIVAASEVAKRSSVFAALVASLPLTSLLAFVWMHVENEPDSKIAQLSIDIAWLVLPSMILFIALPMLLKHGMNFWLSLAISCALTALCYFGLFALLKAWGIMNAS